MVPAILVALAAPVAGRAEVCNGLRAWWSFDQNAGLTAREVAGLVDDHGTLVGGPVWTPGVSGSAIAFDGINDRVEVPLSADLTMAAGLTVSAWVNIDPAAAGFEYILDTYNGAGGYYLRLDLGTSEIDFHGKGTPLENPWAHSTILAQGLSGSEQR